MILPSSGMFLDPVSHYDPIEYTDPSLDPKLEQPSCFALLLMEIMCENKKTNDKTTKKLNRQV